MSRVHREPGDTPETLLQRAQTELSTAHRTVDLAYALHPTDPLWRTLYGARTKIESALSDIADVRDRMNTTPRRLTLPPDLPLVPKERV